MVYVETPKLPSLPCSFKRDERRQDRRVGDDIHVVAAAVHEHAIEKIRVQTPEAALHAHAGVLGGEDMLGLAVAEFLAGLGDEKEFVAPSAHELSQPFFGVP